MSRGRFITLEGGEGAGKTTQLAALAQWLAGAEIDVLTTREPGGSPGANEIRDLLVTGETGRWEPMSELLLHFAARSDHMSRTIRPALDSGRWVVCDRFSDSTMAYQGYGHDLGRAAVEALGALVVGDLAPDLTIVIDVPIEVGLKRTDDRPHQENRYERMTPAFHARVREGFLDIARREPGRCVVVDGAQAAESVADEIRTVVEERLMS
jgi:dTMP kinase